MIFGAILAGGVGSRMNIESMPKQFLPLGDKPVFMHTLEKFLLCPKFDAVYIGVHKDWVEYAEDTVEASVGESSIPVRIVSGGADRNATIMNVVNAILEEHACGSDSVIVTHDSVRPFVKLSVLDRNIEAALQYGACDTVIPATDTIVESRDGEIIGDIPPRSFMYQGQTPQSFKIKVLKEMYDKLKEEDLGNLTDACKILVMQGYPVHMVQGDDTNIKLTTVMDYKLAQSMIANGAE